MNHLGLFAGIGGFELPARWMGWNTVAWCEWDKFCQTVLKYYFPNAEPNSDIKKTDFTRYAGQIDILTGGFPCQPYSTAGKRLGKDDERHLWPEMLRAIREVQPRWVVGENVRGLTNWNGGLVFDEVQADLEVEGYEVLPFLLPACGVDAPHRRDRVWFVAYSNSTGFGQFNFPCEPGFQGFDSWRDYEWNDSDPKGKRLQVGYAKQIRHTPHSTIKRYDSVLYWENFPTQPPICGGNDGVSSRLAGITVSAHRRESIKAYGNAIVPQVALQIYKAIEQYENQRNIHLNHRLS